MVMRSGSFSGTRRFLSNCKGLFSARGDAQPRQTAMPCVLNEGSAHARSAFAAFQYYIEVGEAR